MHWNYTEFKTYLLLEAAHGDMDFSQEEKDIITNKLSEETYDKILSEFHEDSDYQRIEKIRDAAKIYCDTSDKRMDLLESVKDIFISDGIYDTMEKNLMLYLKKLL